MVLAEVHVGHGLPERDAAPKATLALELDHSERRRALAALQRQGDELAPRVGAFGFGKDGPLCDGQCLFGVSLAEMVLDEEVSDFALRVAFVALVQGDKPAATWYDSSPPS